MVLDTNFLLDILALIGGGRGDALNDVTPHLLGMLGWGALCVYQIRISSAARNNSDHLLLAAFVFSCFHEAADFVVSTGIVLSVGSSFFNSGFWPPFELLLCAVSRVLLAAAFIHMLLRQRKFTLDFLLISLVFVATVYAYIAFQWRLAFLRDAPTPFSWQAYAWVMHAAMAVVLSVAILKSVITLRTISWPIVSGLLLLQLESLFTVAGYQEAESLTSVLDPISGCFALAAIGMLGYATLSFNVMAQNRIKQGMQNSKRLESLGLLSSGIAHDFNNHLQIILGYVELAKMQTDSSGASEQSLQRIEEAAERAGALVNQLLAFSRGQAPVFENVDLNETITKLTPLLSRLLGSEIKLVHDLDLGAKSISADTRMIEQIILNLVANARDAIDDQGTVTLRSQALSGHDINGKDKETCYDRTQLMVTDTGKGMDEKTVNHAFEPFFTTKAIGEGTGLGLSTVYGAVQKHNGTISISSKPKTYTSVCIEFPSVELDLEKTDKSLEFKSMPVTISGQTILLAEDETAIRELARTLLEAAGYSVIVASNGQHAINIIKTYKGNIDLCLFDVAMPVLNGYQTYDKISDTHPEIAVLFITGNTARVEQWRSEFPHLQKPFTNKTLLDALASALVCNTRKESAAKEESTTA